jgi:hypothetical protein
MTKFFCAYLASLQGPNNDDHHKKTCIYCGRIGHWLQDCHEKEVDILKLETNRHIRLEVNKLHQLANIVEEESDFKEHGENEQDAPIIELFQLAIALR